MKNTIKILTYINRLLMFFTCGLLISFYLAFYGMYAEILLGAFHVLVALVLLCLWKKLPRKELKKLCMYSGAVIVYFVLGFVLEMYDKIPFVIWIIILPMSLASYLTFILEKIKIRLT